MSIHWAILVSQVQIKSVICLKQNEFVNAYIKNKEWSTMEMTGACMHFGFIKDINMPQKNRMLIFLLTVKSYKWNT